jgi:hypothetical protein
MDQQMFRFLDRLPALCTVFLLLPLALTGCGGQQDATVTGTVLFDGKPITGSQVTVTFMGENGKPGIGKVDPEGNYKVQVAPGNVKITLAVPLFRTLAGGRVQEMDPAKFGAKGAVVKASERNKDLPKIPDRFTDPTKTTLTFIVKPGTQKHDIEIPKK